MNEVDNMNEKNKPANRAPRLPEGYDVETLCALKGQWPKREPSHEELLEIYKAYYSAGANGGSLLLLKAMEARFGAEVRDVMDALYYKLGAEQAEAEIGEWGCLFNKFMDMYTRPHSYQNDHIETSEERIEVRVTKCPFADLARELDLESISRHICLPWHQGYAKTHNYTIKFREMLLEGDECCWQVWEKVGNR